MARLAAPGSGGPARPFHSAGATRRAALAGWLAVSLALAAGLGWRDCVLLATAVALALPVFRAGMSAQAPWQGWRAAARCTLAGSLALLGALALVAWVAWVVGVLMLDGSRQAAETLSGLNPALIVLALTGALAWFSLPAQALGRGALAGFVLAWGLAAMVEVVANNGWPLAACGFALVVAAVVGTQGWRLAHVTAHALMCAALRR